MEGSTNTAEAVNLAEQYRNRDPNAEYIVSLESELDRLRSRIMDLEKALKWNRDALETTDSCLRSWNQNRGSPANVEGAIAEASRLLTEGAK